MLFSLCNLEYYINMKYLQPSEEAVSEVESQTCAFRQLYIFLSFSILSYELGE